MFELEDALAKSRDSSPGGDNIPYFLLKALPMKTKPKLLSVYNQSFQQGEIPKARKLGIIIPNLKPDKNSSDSASYRPITLLPCLSKIMERIIKNRLEFIVEREKLLKPDNVALEKLKELLIYYLDWSIEFDKPLKIEMSLLWST